MDLHEALPELAMVGDKEMQKLMDDNVVPEIPVKFKKFGIEV
jgi:hypothetical protein